MWKRLLSAGAWGAAPKAMFAVRYPKQAAAYQAVRWLTRSLEQTRAEEQRGGRRREIGLVMLAAAVAFPVGLWMARRPPTDR